VAYEHELVGILTSECRLLEHVYLRGPDTNFCTLTHLGKLQVIAVSYASKEAVYQVLMGPSAHSLCYVEVDNFDVGSNVPGLSGSSGSNGGESCSGMHTVEEAAGEHWWRQLCGVDIAAAPPGFFKLHTCLRDPTHMHMSRDPRELTHMHVLQERCYINHKKTHTDCGRSGNGTALTALVLDNGHGFAYTCTSELASSSPLRASPPVSAEAKGAAERDAGEGEAHGWQRKRRCPDDRVARRLHRLQALFLEDLAASIYAVSCHESGMDVCGSGGHITADDLCSVLT